MDLLKKTTTGMVFRMRMILARTIRKRSTAGRVAAEYLIPIPMAMECLIALTPAPATQTTTVWARLDLYHLDVAAEWEPNPRSQL